MKRSRLYTPLEMCSAPFTGPATLHISRFPHAANPAISGAITAQCGEQEYMRVVQAAKISYKTGHHIDCYTCSKIRGAFGPPERPEHPPERGA